MLSLFFVNKPIIILPFLAGIIFIFIISFYVESPFAFAFFFISFIIWFWVSVIYHYILDSNEPLLVKGIDISQFRKPVKIVLIINLSIGALAIAVSFIGPPVGGVPAFVWCVASAISAKSLECYIKGKFISLSLKENSQLKDFDLNAIYTDIREVLLKKLIS